MADSNDIIIARQLVNTTVAEMNELAQSAYASSASSLNALLTAIKNLDIEGVDIGIGGIEPLYKWLEKGAKPEGGLIGDYLPASSDLKNWSDGYLATYLADFPAGTEGIVIPKTIRKEIYDETLVGAKPTAVPYTTVEPAKVLNLTLPTMPTLGTLPTVGLVTPVIDVSLLGAEFSFTEPTYTKRVSPEVEAGIKRVLGGGMGLPQSYWDALWNEVSGALARQQVGKLRMARNRGAASFWALPGETVLAASRAVQDEGARAISQARLEQAKQQAVFAREDFWQAVQQGIAYENQWIAFHQQAAARALAGAEQLINSRIAVHNANITRYNAQLEYAKTASAVQVATLKAALDTYAAKLQAVTVELEKDKTAIAEYQSLWSSFQISSEAQIKKFGETIKWWMQQIDVDMAYPKFKHEKLKLDLQYFTTSIQKSDTVIKAISSLIESTLAIQNYILKPTYENLNVDARYNEYLLKRADLLVKAQEAMAQINVAQSEWLQGMKAKLSESVAQLTSGFAQSAVAAARVGLSSSVGYQSSDDYNTSASRNQEKVW